MELNLETGFSDDQYILRFNWRKTESNKVKSPELVREKKISIMVLFCSFVDSVGMHTQNPVVTADLVNLQLTSIIGDVARYPLVKVHGKF